MDWIGTRVGGRCARWIELVEATPPPGKEGPWKGRTPWWEEVKRCIEGDNVPNRMEGWNHPVAGKASCHVLELTFTPLP